MLRIAVLTIHLSINHQRIRTVDCSQTSVTKQIKNKRITISKKKKGCTDAYILHLLTWLPLSLQPVVWPYHCHHRQQNQLH